jgi:hypothetical protein
MQRHAKGMIGLVLLGVLVAVAIAVAVWTVRCPCERTPGGWLLGDVVEEPVADWSFANSVQLCQIQVSRGPLPHSINLNCMASEGRLYLSCAGCEGKSWSTAALARPEARLRLGEAVYPVRLTRVEDPATLDEAWRARESKLGRDPNRPREAGWWSFLVESRGARGARG